MTGRSIRFGDLDVPVLERAWSEAQGISGFRLIHAMKAGDSWFDVEWDDRFYEALAEVDDIVVPVGVAIASELVSTGADWAYLTEIWRGGLVLLDRDARCVEISGAVARAIDPLREANGGRLAGLPDVVGARGDRVLMREAKRRGKDSLQPQQHQFARVAAAVLGDRLDLAVVEWALPRAG